MRKKNNETSKDSLIEKIKKEKYEGNNGNRGKKEASGLFTAPLFDMISGILQYACVHTVL